MTEKLAAALHHLEAHTADHREALDELVRIGGVSAKPAPNATMRASAEAVVREMERVGLENAEVLELAGVHPYAYAEWLHAEGAPTVLIYGHHDVQPEGRHERWLSPPFEPTERDGRLYGRGTVDDKAGVVMHLAAIRAWLEGAGGLPINVKVVVEGEEEIGSEHLEAFLASYRDRIDADALVLTDTSNLDVGIPALTVSLRGLAGATVEVRSLKQPVHSGMWGGPVPDPVMGLAKALASLTDDRGRVIPALRAGVRELEADERAELESLPFDDDEFKQQAGMVPSAELCGEPTLPVLARLWHEPSLTIIALEARPLEGSSNQIIEAARARISLRTVASQNPEEMRAALVKAIRDAVPWGLEVKIEPEPVAGWWRTDAHGAAFEAARRALAEGYGRPAVAIGCGGSIGFVEPFAKVLGGVPALLTGVEDPACLAHSENESLCLADFHKGMKSNVHLYAELATALS